MVVPVVGRNPRGVEPQPTRLAVYRTSSRHIERACAAFDVPSEYDWQPGRPKCLTTSETTSSPLSATRSACRDGRRASHDFYGLIHRLACPAFGPGGSAADQSKGMVCRGPDASLVGDSLFAVTCGPAPGTHLAPASLGRRPLVDRPALSHLLPAVHLIGIGELVRELERVPEPLGLFDDALEQPVIGVAK